MSLSPFKGSPHFKPSELASPDTGEAFVEQELIDKLEKLREIVDFPLVVTSGYRSEKWNEFVGGHSNSYHLRGMAVDLSVAYDKAYDVLKAALEVDFTGIGVQQKLGSSSSKRFIHLDVRPQTDRTLWSY